LDSGFVYDDNLTGGEDPPREFVRVRQEERSREQRSREGSYSPPEGNQFRPAEWSGNPWDDGRRAPAGIFPPPRTAYRRHVDVDTYNGKNVELGDFLEHFDNAADWNNWSYSEKGLRLALSLRGPAQQSLGSMSVHEKRDYDTLVAVLSKRFDPKERVLSYRCEFKQRRKGKDETVEEYGFALNRLLTRAYREIDSGMREDLLIDQFVAGLGDKEIRKHVQFGHPKTLDEAISLAGEYIAFQGLPGDTTRKPENESQVRHVGESEVALRKELDQMKKMIENLTNRPVTGSYACWSCGERGHFASRCPNQGRIGGRLALPAGRGNNNRGSLN